MGGARKSRKCLTSRSSGSLPPSITLRSIGSRVRQLLGTWAFGGNIKWHQQSFGIGGCCS
jgi:hypothetical protein